MKLKSEKDVCLTAKISPILRAQFKEEARRIISRDRSARKNGLSQNTIGEIERALVTAYNLGNSQIDPANYLTPQSCSGFINWIEIQVRARDTLMYMTFGYSLRFRESAQPASEIQRFYENGKARWTIISENIESERSIANGSVAPLIKSGLIEPVDGDENRFQLTPIGKATCIEYWRRSDNGDRTLPKVSLR